MVGSSVYQLVNLLGRPALAWSILCDGIARVSPIKVVQCEEMFRAVMLMEVLDRKFMVLYRGDVSI